jgi:hypothetical protein
VNGAEALRAVLRPPILNHSLLVALFVGTLLNGINQGDAVLSGHSPDWLKLALTFAVPFFVASFGAWSALRR